MFWLGKQKSQNGRHSIAVIGLSSFGHYLCRNLSQLGAEILAIDVQEKRIDEIKEFVQKAVVADARSREILEDLELASFDDVVVSVGSDIEASILITLHLREMGVKEIVAKAVTEDHAKILNIIGAERIVFPERDIAERMANILHHPNLLDYIPLGEDYSIIELAPPAAWIGKSLTELHIRRNYHVQIVMVKEVIPQNVMLIPTGDHIIKDSDILVVLGREVDLEKVKNI